MMHLHSNRTPATRVVGVLVFTAFWLLFSATILPAQAQSTTTRVMVRAVANDAKLIGSNVGGARIVITRASDGTVLADGLQAGSTGDTKRIVIDPRPRHGTVFNTDGAAGFTAELQLSSPTLVEITAYAPLGDPAGLVHSSKRMWLVPGQHVEGEGVVIELNGFTVNIVSPRSEKAERTGRDIQVEARVTLLCGCPTEPDGIWDSNDITVEATLFDGEQALGRTTLLYAGVVSTYSGVLTGLEAGRYRLEVVAMDAAHGNFGVSHLFLTIE